MIDQSVAAAQAVAALESLISGIQERLRPTVEAALAHGSEQIAAIQDVVAAPAAAAIMSATVNVPLDGTDGPVDWTPLYDALDSLDSSIWAIQQPVNAAVESAQAHVSVHTDAILPSAGDLLGGALSAFASLVSGLLGDLATTDDLWSALYAKIREGFSGDQDPLAAFITKAVSDLIHGAIAPLTLDIPELPLRPPQADTTELGSVPTVEDIEAQWEHYPAFVRSFIQAGIIVANSFALYSAMGSGWISKYQQRSLIQETPTPLSPPELSQLIRRGFIEQDWGTQHAKRSGVSPELFALMQKLSQSFLTAENYVEMWRRTGDDGHLDMLHTLGLGDDDVSRLRTLALAIPTPSDLVRFMVRDAFDPAAIAAGNLDFQFDQKVDADWNRRVGVDVDTLKLYWRSHWTLPSPTMYYAMFHRGFITVDQMKEALAVSDFAPGWIDNLVAINYLVPSRIDVRRMWESGVITDRAELVKRHTDMGYSPDDAETLATFVEDLKRQQDETAAQKLRGPIVQAVIKSYADGAEDYATAHDHLVALGLTDETATYELQSADLFRERDRADRIKTAIGREYVRGFISKDDAQGKLDGFGFEQNEADGLFASWDLDRELADLSAEAHHQRDLTRAEIIEAYTDHLIDSADAAAHLTQMGFSGDEAATLIALADFRAAKADQKIVQTALRTQYVKRETDDPTVRGTLASFGYTQVRIDALLTEWTLEREAARPQISTGTLERLVMQGVVPLDQLQPELERRGYTPSEVNWWLTLWGTDVSVAADKLEEQKREFAIREARLTSAQQAQKDRFSATQAQQQVLQTQRLQAQQASQAATQAFSVQRDAQAAATRLQASHDAQAAIAARQDKALDAAAKRQAVADAQHQRAIEAQAAVAARAQAAQDARQQASLSAQAARLQTTIDARAAAAAAAAQSRSDLQASRDATAKQILDLKDQIAQAHEIRQSAATIAKEQRSEAANVRKENRSQARTALGTAQAAQVKAQLDALQKNRDAAVADLNAKLATLEATAASQRQAAALQAQQAAQQLLTANLPPGTFTDTAI